MNKLLDSAELGRPESKNPAELQRTDDLVLPRYCFLPTRTRESTSANVNNSVLAKKSTKELNVWAEPKLRHLECLRATNNHQGGLWDSEDKAGAKIISVPDSAISSTYPARTVENNFDWDNVCHMLLKVFCSVFTTAMCNMHNYNSFRWRELFDQVWISFVWQTFPKLYIVVIFVQQTRLRRFPIFLHSTNPMWLPTCCSFCHINFRSF